MPKRTYKPTRNKTKLARRKAHQEAELQDPLRQVEPDSVRVDSRRMSRTSWSSPRAGRDKAYAPRPGKVFHPAWCQGVVADKWDQDPAGLLVILEAEAGERRP